MEGCHGKIGPGNLEMLPGGLEILPDDRQTDAVQPEIQVDPHALDSGGRQLSPCRS